VYVYTRVHRTPPQHVVVIGSLCRCETVWWDGLAVCLSVCLWHSVSRHGLYTAGGLHGTTRPSSQHAGWSRGWSYDVIIMAAAVNQMFSTPRHSQSTCPDSQTAHTWRGHLLAGHSVTDTPHSLLQLFITTGETFDKENHHNPARFNSCSIVGFIRFFVSVFLQTLQLSNKHWVGKWWTKDRILLFHEFVITGMRKLRLVCDYWCVLLMGLVCNRDGCLKLGCSLKVIQGHRF